MTCPACCAEAQISERIFTADLAKHWAHTKAHGKATPYQIKSFVREDIKSDEIDVYRCPVCQVEFMHPARTWSASRYPHEEHSLGWDHAEALRTLQALGPRTVLDIGCADGQFLDKLAQQGHTATGIDFSPGDVKTARDRGREAYVADLSRNNELVSGNRRFEVITMFQVIEHLEHPDLVFAGIARVAEPGALLLVGCPSSRRYTRGCKHPELVGSSDFWDSPPQHVLRWTPEGLKRFGARHGWATERTAFEPLQPLHAAAHLAGLGSFQGKPWARRAATIGYFLRLIKSDSTGIRLFWAARLAA